MSLDIINARPLRKQVERFHDFTHWSYSLWCYFALLDMSASCFYSETLSFFFDTIMQMIAYLIRFWLLLSLTISCPALRLCCYSLYLSLFRGKPVSLFFWLRNAATPWKTLRFYHVQIHHVLFTWARTLHSTPEGLEGQFVATYQCISAGRTKAFFLLYSKKVRLTTPPRIV